LEREAETCPLTIIDIAVEFQPFAAGWEIRAICDKDYLDMEQR
jgi:hypothetical protein